MIAPWLLVKFMFPTIASCSTLRIGPYLFYVEKFITQLKQQKNRCKKRTCLGLDLLLFHSVGLLVSNVSILELNYYKWIGHHKIDKGINSNE